MAKQVNELFIEIKLFRVKNIIITLESIAEIYAVQLK